MKEEKQHMFELDRGIWKRGQLEQLSGAVELAGGHMLREAALVREEEGEERLWE